VPVQVQVQVQALVLVPVLMLLLPLLLLEKPQRLLMMVSAVCRLKESWARRRLQQPTAMAPTDSPWVAAALGQALHSLLQLMLPASAPQLLALGGSQPALEW